MKEERTRTFVKPGSIRVAEHIFAYLDSLLVEDFHRDFLGLIYPTREQMDEFYSHMREMPFHNASIERYVSEGLVLCDYSGSGIIRRIRSLVGNTDPLKAKPWTIRGMFGSDSLEVAYKEGRFLENVFHASENNVEAERELKFFGL